jgi:very-short-patch-repair endonuclease
MPEPSHRYWRATPAMLARARELRRNMTPAERKLWNCLRGRQVNGAHFRKQSPVSNFILDFLCSKAKLVVEIDGDSHADPEQAEYDAMRTCWLNEQKDYRVVRFANADVLHNTEGVLAAIVEALEEAHERSSRSNPPPPPEL